MKHPPIFQVHQSQRTVLPMDDVLFDDQLRLTTSSSGHSGRPVRDTPPSRYIPAASGDNRVLLHHTGSSDHLTAFARPAQPCNTGGGHHRTTTDSPGGLPVQQLQHRKKVGFADDTVSANNPPPGSSAGSTGSPAVPPPPRYDEAVDGSNSRGVSPWRHHKSAIV